MKTMRIACGFILTISLLSACTHNITGDVDEVARHKNKNTKAAAVNMQLGLGYLKQGNVRRAKQKLIIANEQAPNSPDVAGALAYYFEKTANKEQARKYYLKALQLAPGQGSQLNNYGAFLCRQGEYLQANRYFEQATKDLNYMNSSGALENAGLCALAIPNLTLAKQYFERAIGQDPRRTTSIYELAKIAFEAKQYQQALGWVDRYQESNPLRADITSLAYQSAKAMGQLKKAESFEWILKTRFPESVEYKNLLASTDNDKTKSIFS